MKLFTCTACKALVFFENDRCTTCGHALAYLPDLQRMSALEGNVALENGARYRACANTAVCNWTVPEASPDTYCLACRPNDTVPTDVDAWRRIEVAKRRLIYTLLGLRLPVVAKSVDPRGLVFAFAQDAITGHADGKITINIAEADTPHREQMREQMGETYRTLLGHFRHEIGHYYWQRLIADAPEGFRERFGDERADYAAAQQRHYQQGPPADWRAHFVSAYASMHPWEDWAETWAHYLHMVDTLETARSYGLALRPAPLGGAPLAQVVARRLDFDDFDDLITAWVPLTLALNSLNRSMGVPDPYAFVLSTEAIAKLRWVHDAIDRAA